MPTFRPAALAFFRANSKETDAVLSFIGMHKKSIVSVTQIDFDSWPKRWHSLSH